jgi:hypothetical protein
VSDELQSCGQCECCAAWRQAADRERPLQHELFDLLTLMPDTQLSGIVEYIRSLGEARGHGPLVDWAQIAAAKEAQRRQDFEGGMAARIIREGPHKGLWIFEDTPPEGVTEAAFAAYLKGQP